MIPGREIGSVMANNYKDASIKCILKHITERCKQEASHGLAVPLNDPKARVLFYTGLTSSMLDKLQLDKPKISMLDLQSRILILESVKCVFTQNRLPVFSTIFEEANQIGQIKTMNDKLVLGLNVFTEEMETLGFHWKETIQSQKIVLEDPEIRFERYMYLNQIKKFRQNSAQWQQIVYVDERLINDAQLFHKLWLADPPPKSSFSLDESVFYHAVSKTGFITGMFSNQFSEVDMNKWLTDILLMHLKSPSIIIMNNNAMHDSLESMSSITRYHTKNDMLQCLTDNNIPCSSNMSKPALFELIKKCNEGHKEYKVDRIMRSQGHEVLRLPLHLFDLSMTTPLWQAMIKNGGFGVTNTLMHLQNEIMKVINNITLPNWEEYEESIKKIEDDIFNIDMVMEKFCDKYELKLSK